MAHPDQEWHIAKFFLFSASIALSSVPFPTHISSLFPLLHLISPPLLSFTEATDITLIQLKKSSFHPIPSLLVPLLTLGISL